MLDPYPFSESKKYILTRTFHSSSLLKRLMTRNVVRLIFVYSRENTPAKMIEEVLTHPTYQCLTANLCERTVPPVFTDSVKAVRRAMVLLETW